MRPTVMRYVAFASALALGACGIFQTDPKNHAEQCVSDQVPNGTKVSVAKAHELVGNCREAIREWLDATMAHACRGRCDYSDPRNVEERRDRERIIEEHLMISVSDEVRPRLSGM